MQGLLLSSFFWTYAFMQIPGGMLADRFKPRIVIAVATLGWGFFQAIAAVCTSWVVLLLTRLGLGAVGGADLSRRRQAQRDLDDAERARPRRDTARRRRAARRGARRDRHRRADRRPRLVAPGLRRRRRGHDDRGLWAWCYIRNTPREHPGVNEAEARYIEEAHAREDAAVAGERAAAAGPSFFRYRSVWCMCFGWMFFNTVFYGLLTWMPNYLSKVHGFDIKQLGGASFIIFFSGFVGELVGGWIADNWRAAGARPNTVFRTLFGIAAVVATVSIFSVAYVDGPDRRRRPAVHHAVLPALVRPVLGDPVDPRPTRARVGLPGRLHEPRRQHRRHRGADHRRADRPADRLLLPGADVLRRGRRALSSSARRRSTTAGSCRSKAVVKASARASGGLPTHG